MMRPRPRGPAVPVLLLALAAVLAGCASAPRPQPAELVVQASWGPWAGEEVRHLLLTIRNTGGTAAEVGPAGEAVSVSGPFGAVPLVWTASGAGRSVAPGNVVDLALHPVLLPEGVFAVSLDHATGIVVPAPPGEYRVCVGTDCTLASNPVG